MTEGILGNPEIVSEPLVVLTGDLPSETLTIDVSTVLPHTLQTLTSKLDPVLLDPPLRLPPDSTRTTVDIGDLKRSSIRLGKQIEAGALNIAFEAYSVDDSSTDERNPAHRRLVAVGYQPTLPFLQDDTIELDINKSLGGFRLGAQALAIANNDRVPGIPIIIDIKAVRVRAKANDVYEEDFLLPVIVMERGDHNLGDANLPPAELVRMCTQITLGLRYMAAKFSFPTGANEVQEATFHDIKPSNIIQVNDYDSNGKVIATRYAMIDSESHLLLPASSSRQARTTDQLEALHTPRYTAPEALFDDPTTITAKSEIQTGRAKMYAEQYSLAVTLLELLCHKAVLPPIDLEEMFEGQDWPHLKKFFTRATSSHPKDRFDSLAEFHLAFMSAMKDDGKGDNQLLTEEQFAAQIQELAFHERRLFGK